MLINAMDATGHSVPETRAEGAQPLNPDMAKAAKGIKALPMKPPVRVPLHGDADNREQSRLRSVRLPPGNRYDANEEKQLDTYIRMTTRRSSRRSGATDDTPNTQRRNPCG